MKSSMNGAPQTGLTCRARSIASASARSAKFEYCISSTNRVPPRFMMSNPRNWSIPRSRQKVAILAM